KAHWDPKTNQWVGSEHPKGYADVSTKAPTGPKGVVSLAPTGGWLSETNLKRIWIDERSGRTNGKPFTIDGLLYSNNAIFTMARKRENSSGVLNINGGVVASDVGMLAGAKLELNYDQRLSGGVVEVKSHNELVIRPKLFPSKIVHINKPKLPQPSLPEMPPPATPPGE
ncbi:MAG: hypothetical protein AAF517_20240, partial [Planctomycetota bacterium]